MTLETRLKGMSYEDVKEAWEHTRSSKTPKIFDRMLFHSFYIAYLQEEHNNEYMTEIDGDE